MAFQESIDSARENFLQAKTRLIQLLETTADDKLNWSPSESARSPIRVAAHASQVVHDITEMLDGRTFAIPTTEEAEVFFAEREKPFSTREEVFELLEKNSTEFLAWLDKLTPQSLEGSMTLPFGLGSIPMSQGITVQALHMNDHNGQLAYIQTIYGDRTWH